MGNIEELEFNFEGGVTLPCRILDGYHGAGKKGQYYGKVAVGKQFWAIVKWDGEDDPDMHKAKGIEVARPEWQAP